MSLQKLSDDELVAETKNSIEVETLATSKVISCFQEIYDRKLYLKRGYSSLFEMVIDVFKYCAGSAQLRINAMRLIQDVPSVKEKLDSREMSLTVAANVQTFLYREKKSNRPYSQNAKLDLIETCTGKSVSEVQREFVRRNPEIEKREIIRPMSEDRVRVSHSSSNRLEEKLRRIKYLWSHVDPDMSREDLLDRMADLVLERIDPIKKAERAQVRQSRVVKTENVDSSEGSLHSNEVTNETASFASLHPYEVKRRNRFIKSKVQNEVWRRNSGKGCEHVDPFTLRRCGSQFQLQFDHIHPYSEGGSNESKNLRILCAAHNRYRWHRRSESRVKSVQVAYR